MQIGLNNEIDFQQERYHIQTEDLGLRSGVITSQIFRHGQIVDTIEVNYAKHIEGIDSADQRDELIRKRMRALHKLCYRNIQSGKYSVRHTAPSPPSHEVQAPADVGPSRAPGAPSIEETASDSPEPATLQLTALHHPLIPGEWDVTNTIPESIDLSRLQGRGALPVRYQEHPLLDESLEAELVTFIESGPEDHQDTAPSDASATPAVSSDEAASVVVPVTDGEDARSIPAAASTPIIEDIPAISAAPYAPDLLGDSSDRAIPPIPKTTSGQDVQGMSTVSDAPHVPQIPPAPSSGVSTADLPPEPSAPPLVTTAPLVPEIQPGPFVGDVAMPPSPPSRTPGEPGPRWSRPFSQDIPTVLDETLAELSRASDEGVPPADQHTSGSSAIRTAAEPVRPIEGSQPVSIELVSPELPILAVHPDSPPPTGHPHPDIPEPRRAFRGLDVPADEDLVKVIEAFFAD